MSEFVRSTVEPADAAVFDRLNDLDNWPDCRISFKAAPRVKGEPRQGMGLWPRVLDLPEAMVRLFIKMAQALDPAGFERASAAEVAMGWGEELVPAPVVEGEA
jgi:hypothetical protein